MRILVAFVTFNVTLVLTNDLEEFAVSNRQFSANIYKELAAKNTGNFVGCPMSTQIVLSMVHAGAKQQTAQQLATGLSLPNDPLKIKSMIELVLPKLQSVPQLFTLKTVNKMYVNRDLKINQDFKTTATDIFKSPVESVKFKKPSKAVTKINAWVAKSTEKRVQNFLGPSDINKDTKSILLNTLYFQGTWAIRFNVILTKKVKFYINKTTNVQVDMMETTETFDYLECRYMKAKFLKMPYIGDDFSMVVILPIENDGLAYIETNIHKLLGPLHFTSKKVQVNFPKFKMEATVKLVPILEKLGIVDLFKPGADLSGMAQNATSFYINDVIQKNYIEVNENGTIAAGTSAIVGDGFYFDPERPVEFVADHPFIYYINSPVGILFVGRFSGH